MNYGRRFPVAFVWVQATTDGGRTQLLLTGGKLLWQENKQKKALYTVSTANHAELVTPILHTEVELVNVYI